jgi:hypothetical protein
VPFTLRNPAGLWLLVLLAPLVLLYVLKQRRETLRVASVWLWQAAQRDLLAKKPFRRLIPEPPLLLEALAIVLLALAVAGPTTRGGEIPGEHVALVIDASASMKTLDAAGRTRLSLAQDAARAALGRLGPGAAAFVVQAGREPTIVAPADRDRRRLERAIDRVRAGDVEGRLGQAIAAASDQLRQRRGERRIVLITDGALAERELPRSAVPITTIRVGAAAENAAIVRFDVASAFDPVSGREQVQAFALIENFGAHRRDAFVTLTQRNSMTPLASRRVTLEPGERAPVVLSFEPAPGDAGTGLVAEISPRDALPADDRAYGRVPPSRKLPVVLSPAKPNPWVARALLADPDLEIMTAPLEELATAGIPKDALVVVDGACPKPLPGNDFMILNPPEGPCYLANVGAVLERPALTSWTENDARFRFLTLDGVEIARARRIDGESPSNALVRTREAAVVADVSVPGRTGTLIGFDVGESNWPLKASFVLFVRNVVELARAHQRARASGPFRTGEPLRVRVPDGVERAELERPGGEREELQARSGSLIVPNVHDAGFYFVSWSGEQAGSALLAANLTSTAESDLRERALPEILGASAAAAGAGIADVASSWSWLLGAAALSLIGLDVYWVTRRPRRSGPVPGRPRAPERRLAEGARA